jgi:hypothetical protein
MDVEEICGCDEVEKSKSKSVCRNDFASMLIEFVRLINFKMAFYIFILGLLIFSSLFVERVLVGFSSAVEDGTPTNKGVIIQLTFLSLAYIIIDLLTKTNVL